MSSLHVIRGRDHGTHFQIRGATATLGRGTSCNIRLNDTEVSRLHAAIVRDGEEHEIVDKNSSNGTFVNSRRVNRQVLQSGDRIQVGRSLLIYTGGPEARRPAHETKLLNQDQLLEGVELVSGDDANSFSNITGSMASRVAIGNEEPHSNFDSPPEVNAGKVGAGQAGISQSPLTGESPFAAEQQTVPQPSQQTQTSSDESRFEATGEDLDVVFQVSQAVRRTLDLEVLLAQILDLIFESIPCGRGCILMFDSVTGQLRPSCSRDRRGSALEQPTQRLRISQTILDHVTQTREGVITSNAQEDDRWESVESIARIGIHEAICVPMLGRYGLVGTVYVDTTQSPGAFAESGQEPTFGQRQLRLLMAIANQAAMAIEDTQFYQAMIQSERLAAMGQAVANLSHHAKNLLQGIQGGAYLVQDGIKKEKMDVIEKGWSIVERNQERVSGLVMDMLSFSKDREPDYQNQDLVALVREILESVQPQADELGVSMEAVLPEAPLKCDFDSEGLHRAILNVLLNAIDATSTGDVERPRVRIVCEAKEAENCVRLEIADNGPGISESDLDRIFVPFESTKGARGTGLGLPVSRKVLREHGGDITAQSAPGQGAVFCFSWPMSRQ